MIEIKLMSEADEGLVNTSYGVLGALWAHWMEKGVLEPLEKVEIEAKTVHYSPTNKLHQILLSILAGCERLSEVNVRLKPDRTLAKLCGLAQFADQSTLARMVDELSQKQIEQLREKSTSLMYLRSQTRNHDWRGHLWLDFDLTGLVCGKSAEKAEKGYFSGKKTQWDVSWRG
jgi:hypothetical protein